MQGTLIHSELADMMRAEKMAHLGIEVSYDSDGEITYYGAKDSVRFDYTVYNPRNPSEILKVFDIKPQPDGLDTSWLNKAMDYTELSDSDFEAISY